MGFNRLKVTEPLQENKLIFAAKFPVGWKAESTLEPTSGFEYGIPGLGILHPNR